MPSIQIANFGPPAVVTDGATQVIDCSQGGYFTWTVAANRTVSAFLTPAGGSMVLLEVTQDATGSRILTWPANVSWAAGTAPTLTVTAGATDILRFTWSATAGKWRGETVGKAFA